ncbi:F-box protein CPR1-like [Cornus florida]|uniref:F-box protein CPR1-like n=1 Tax=Cornus florida TaxID=4283 RepID=UPI002898CDC1|nr:F-box protein CPR1-like [Cornus florida]
MKGKKRSHQFIEADDLIADFLSRLPVQTLLRFRRVSKQWWFDSIDEVLKLGTIFYLVDKVKLEPNPPFKSKRPWLVGSCNGLICVRGENEAIMLLNPFTKKHLILPSVSTLNLYNHNVHYGIGYDPVNDDYKIVRVIRGYESFYNQDHYHSDVWVYSLRLNLWRMVHDNFPYELRHRYTGVLVNGALHWLAGHQDNNIVLKCLVDEIIVSFDPVAEKYWMLQFPPFRILGA